MDHDDYGPAMRALSEQQRKFVLAMASDPFGNAAAWARAAGYSDVAKGAKVSGHHALHNPKVQAAVEEFARGQFQTVGPMLATAGMLRIARNPRHPKHARTLETIANRVGLHETTEQRVSVRHLNQTGAAMVDRIKQLCAELGVDPATLLGENAAAAPGMKLIEGEVLEDVSKDV